MIRLATETDATFAPYSNICPISGHTGAEIEQRGVNLFDKSTVVHGYKILGAGQIYPDSNVACTDFIAVKQGVTLYCSPNWNAGLNVIFFYDSTKQLIGKDANNTHIYSVPNNCCYIRLNMLEAEVDSATVNYPATDTEYHPYTGNQISVTFPETIHGGEDEVISGSLKKTMVSVKVSDLPVNVQFEVGTYACWKRFALPAICKPVLYNQVHGAISSMGVETTAYYGSKHINEASAADVDFAITVTGESLAIYDSDLSLTDTTFMEKYGDMQVVYPLAETVEYTLTENEMDTLYGTNNIWSSTGDTEVTYPADTKLYIDGKIAEAIAALNA
jgi:hypothetical protein